MKRFEYSYFITSSSKLSCTSYSGRATADNCNLNSILFNNRFRCITFSHMVVCNESFHTADSNWFSLDTTNAPTLALILLWTYSSANCRKCILSCDNFICCVEVTFGNLLYELWNWNIYRTSTYTRLVLAM